MHKARVFKLESADITGVRRLLSDRIAKTDVKPGDTIVVNVTRTGHFFDPRYGDFDITRDMLLSMIDNFDKNVFGQEVVLDRAHRPSDGSCGFFRQLFLDGDKLRAKIELTDFGIESIKKRGFIYVSAEFSDNYQDNESRKEYGPTLLGAGLTPRPVVKHLDPIRLSEDTLDGVPTYVTDRFSRILQEDLAVNLKELMQKLRKKLSEFNLAEAIINQLINSYEAVATKAANEDIQMTLMEAFVEQGKVLADAIGDGNTNVTLDINMPDLGTGKTLSEEDIDKLVIKKLEDRDAASRKLAEDLEANKAIFTKALSECEGLTDLPKEFMDDLLGTADLITAEMTEDQVTRLAEQQINLGQRMVAQTKLAAQGFMGGTPAGSVHITVDDSNNIKSLQETIDKRLGLADMADSKRYGRTSGSLQAENKAFTEKVLAQYDAEHAAQLQHEHKLLAGGDGIVSDVAVPASFERTVIREALYNLVGMQFVDVNTLPFASSHMIPYSYRDTTAAGRSNTRVYEGGSIPRAGVIQTSETAYALPQKISFEVSDELRYLTQAGHLNWDATAENQRNASRIITEDTEQLIFNEQLQASDEFSVTAVSNENLELQADDTKNVFVLANFPVVRPRAVYDLQGNQVGSTTNAITVTYNSVALDEYDGTGTQSAGTYYVLDYNLGEIYLVDESGAIQTPANGTAYTIAYSYTNNVSQFDTDNGSVEEAVYWDTFLKTYGLRKSAIEDDRYYMPNFGLMSGNVQNQVEQARKFAANYKVPATELQTNGNVGRIKEVPNYKTSAPGLWMGDQRVLIGERGTTRLRMMKPWTMGDLENQKDANGRFTGKKEAYGDQFILLHTPTQLKAALTSIVLYSSSGRVARVTP